MSTETIIEKKTVTIDRSRWLHGEGGRASSLQRATDGKRCCIGFVCLAFGAKEVDIVGCGSPLTEGNLPRAFDAWDLSSMNGEGHRALHAAFAINDCFVGQRPGTSSGGSLQDAETVAIIKKYGADDRGAAPIKDDADREARLVKLFADQGIELVFEGEYPAPPAPEGEVTP